MPRKECTFSCLGSWKVGNCLNFRVNSVNAFSIDDMFKELNVRLENVAFRKICLETSFPKSREDKV